MAQAFRIEVLGELRVTSTDGEPVALPASRKARSLLAYLVLSGRRQRRQHLCDLLWDGVDDPRAALRWSLSRLRSAVNGPAEQRLESDRISIGISEDAFAVDLFEVRRLLGENVEEAPLNELREAAKMFRGELLEGLDLLDSFRFHSWCVGEREAARALRLRILRTLTSRVPDPNEALRHAYDLVSVDPLDESAQTRVMQLLVQAGRQLDAQEQLRAYKRALEIELGVVPSDITMRLRKIIRDKPVAVPRPPLRPAHAVVATIPLVGREAELERFSAWLAEPHAPMALLSGDPGQGKTRMMHEVVRLAQQRGAATIGGRAYAAESGRAFGPWRDALARAEGVASALATLPDDAQEQQARSRIFDELLSVVMAERGDAERLVITMDDLQWMDEASAAFLHFVARGAASRNVLLVCAMRPAELLDNPAVERVLDALRADGKLFEFKLASLDASAVAQICDAVDDGIDSAHVMDRSEGNPFFAVEVARALARGETALPANTRRVVEDRLRALSEGARELLPWAASLGRTFHIDVLERVTKLDPVALVERVGELEERGVFEPKGSNGYDFTHDLVRDAAYRQLSGPRRRMVHRSIARSLAAWDGRTDAFSSTELLRHAELGQEQIIACHASVAAAREALSLSAWVDACSIADRGLQHTSALGDEERLRALLELLRCRIQAASFLQRPHPAHIASALDNAATLGGSAEQKFEALYLRSVVHSDHGEEEHAEKSTVAAVDVGRSADPETAARLIAQTARCLIHWERDVERARGLHTEAQDALQALDLADIEHHWSAALLAQWDGELDAAVERLETALELARQNGDRWREASCTTCLMKVCLEARRLDRVSELAERPFAFEEEGARAPRSPFIQALAAIAQLRRDGDCGSSLADSLDALRERNANVQLAYVLANLARFHLEAGRLDEAEAAAEEAVTAAEAVTRPVSLNDALSTTARVMLARGDDAGAREALARAEGLAEQPHLLCLRVRELLSDVATKLDAPAPS
jgi:DNA-binding SARP family transcriptional activator/tetratricopeptide (TPR) repeat protein